MLIPTANRKAIYEYLFKEGVLVAKKDYNAPKHPEIDVPNLQVIKALQSLKSRGYVTDQFSWQYFYYFLTDAGVQYLRSYLHLPEEIVPATAKKAVRPARISSAPGGGNERRDREPRSGDDGYRRRGDEKKVGAGADFNPQFRGGFGRAAAAAPAPRQ